MSRSKVGCKIGLGAGLQPSAVVIHFVAALDVQFLNWFSLPVLAGDHDVGLNFAVRVEGSLLVAPRTVARLDVLIGREIGLRQKNLLMLNI